MSQLQWGFLNPPIKRPTIKSFHKIVRQLKYFFVLSYSIHFINSTVKKQIEGEFLLPKSIDF